MRRPSASTTRRSAFRAATCTGWTACSDQASIAHRGIATVAVTVALPFWGASTTRARNAYATGRCFLTAERLPWSAAEADKLWSDCRRIDMQRPRHLRGQEAENHLDGAHLAAVMSAPLVRAVTIACNAELGVLHAAGSHPSNRLFGQATPGPGYQTTADDPSPAP